jgi:hypothetical protein
MIVACHIAPRTGAACQRQHWTSHKRQCLALAEHEFASTFGHYTEDKMAVFVNNPGPSDVQLLLKLSALSWTLRSGYAYLHFASLNGRAILLHDERPAPGDTKEGLLRLLRRAATEFGILDLYRSTPIAFEEHLENLSWTARLGEPETAVDIFRCHTGHVNLERQGVAPESLATYYIRRSECVLLAAVKFERDEGRRGAFVAEANGVMERATRTLQGLQLEELDVSPVSDRKTARKSGPQSAWRLT